MPQLGSQKPGLCSLSLLLHAGFTRARALPARATWLPILRDNSASPRRLCRWCVCPTVRICLHPFPSTRPGRRKTFLRIDSHGSAGGCALGLARVCTREVCVRRVSVCRAGGTVAQRVLNARVWTCRARGGARVCITGLRSDDPVLISQILPTFAQTKNCTFLPPPPAHPAGCHSPFPLPARDII